METQENVLIELGLSNNEAKVYITLLELGCTTVTNISRKSKIHRTNVYDSLERLHEKGIVAYLIKENAKYFQATDPDFLMNLLKEKEHRLLSIIPQLKVLDQFSEEKGDACIYKGTKAFKNILYSYLKYSDSIMTFGIPKNAVELIGPWVNIFHKERISRKIDMRHIYNENAKERIKYLNSLPYTHGRYLPGKFNSPVSTNICGDEISLVLWSKNPLIISIKNKEISDSYKRYFNLLWSISKSP
jgi:HTH-type transcriptional regulator, sugar sensing transcriptional regulator